MHKSARITYYLHQYLQNSQIWHLSPSRRPISGVFDTFLADSHQNLFSQQTITVAPKAKIVSHRGIQYSEGNRDLSGRDTLKITAAQFSPSCALGEDIAHEAVEIHCFWGATCFGINYHFPGLPPDQFFKVHPRPKAREAGGTQFKNYKKA